MNWHLTYEGPKCTEMQSSSESSTGLGLSQDPLVLIPIPPAVDSVAQALVLDIPGDDDMT